ncbi:hypothetical protein SDRG_04397 [Saprolegnia diclina VS20]|uniref:Uncharacterized protein n=1 Tax=Saprolegnia diclina (strain VS20) TaxID=1156394 RepID=T0QZA8_SAPDV|nr:hypothetical protein SDRG_04397 [Saprolegnia diclina VS20]XP_008621479.1 hypothetical protein SDRG_17024 [Saprolegnia diclina VS20]EQC25088.1 hypothetical protein SDRG_17024 [Saprolegnia diclina VS20]EQC37967.1 hypothetical protein SDRG_04397 [Saprolegnia diclina VS20]|eukprot:XP_008608294.1 hypothetical protein SDRG_04397 [Saprolegnia diclina VS20]
MSKPSPRCSACNAEARVRGPQALRAGSVGPNVQEHAPRNEAAERDKLLNDMQLSAMHARIGIVARRWPRESTGRSKDTSNVIALHSYLEATTGAGAKAAGGKKRARDATDKPKEPKPKRVKKPDVRRKLDLPVAA